MLGQANAHTGEPEHLVHLPATKLKRSRQARGEVTLYSETAHYAKLVLDRLRPGEPLFPFGYRQALELFTSAVRKSKATSMPFKEPVRWKDLRSGMACHLLRHGLTREQVNARLGHTPSSDTLDAYINFLALDRTGPKRRLLAAVAEPPRSVRVQAPIPSHIGGAVSEAADAELMQARREIDDLRRRLDAVVGALRPTVAPIATVASSLGSVTGDPGLSPFTITPLPPP
jgi:hypothetical protein